MKLKSTLSSDGIISVISAPDTNAKRAHKKTNHPVNKELDWAEF